MKKIIFCIILFIGTFAFGQNTQVNWSVTQLKDKFGDLTIKKRIVYKTTGTFSNNITQNSKIDVFILIDSPSEISIVIYEYGKYRVILDECFFDYKINNEIINGVPLNGGYYLISNQPLNDKKTSLIYLLKNRSGIIKVITHKDNTLYKFNINTYGFLKLLSNTFNAYESNFIYCDTVKDINNKQMCVSFNLKYKWTMQNENLLSENIPIKNTIRTFFMDKDEAFRWDKPGGYYQNEKIKQKWGLPLLNTLKTMFPDIVIDVDNFFVN